MDETDTPAQLLPFFRAEHRDRATQLEAFQALQQRYHALEQQLAALQAEHASLVQACADAQRQVADAEQRANHAEQRALHAEQRAQRAEQRADTAYDPFAEPPWATDAETAHRILTDNLRAWHNVLPSTIPRAMVDQAFRELLRLCHPDKWEDAEVATELTKRVNALRSQLQTSGTLERRERRQSP
jgi:hypothetical protein